MLRKARAFKNARAEVSEGGRLEVASPSSIMSDWRRVRRQVESFLASGVERKLEIVGGHERAIKE